MNYELSDKLKSAIEEEIARLACISDMSKEVALGTDTLFTPTRGLYAGHRVEVYCLRREGTRVRVGKEVYKVEDSLWHSDSGVWRTGTEVALECREARRAGKIVEILNIGEGEEE